MKFFKYFSAVQWTFTKKNELSKPFILVLENPQLYATYQDFFMLNVDTNYIFARQVREKTDKNKCAPV